MAKKLAMSELNISNPKKRKLQQSERIDTLHLDIDDGERNQDESIPLPFDIPVFSSLGCLYSLVQVLL